MPHRAGMDNFLSTDIYAITAEEYSLGRSNIEVVKQLMIAGIKVVQYREKDKKAGQMYDECLKIRELTREAGITFIINDHIDLALLIGADGVHIGQQDLPPAKVRQLVGPEMVIGLSTHSPDQAKAASELKCIDYIGVGPIFATQTKKDVCQPVGLTYLEYVARQLDVPFVAIGGIKEHNSKEVKQHGAKIIAIVTDIVGAPDIPAKVQAIRQAIHQ